MIAVMSLFLISSLTLLLLQVIGVRGTLDCSYATVAGGAFALDVCVHTALTGYVLASMYSCDANGIVKQNIWVGSSCYPLSSPAFTYDTTTISSVCNAGTCDASKYAQIRFFGAQCPSTSIENATEIPYLINECIYNPTDDTSQIHECTDESWHILRYSGASCTPSSFQFQVDYDENECLFLHFSVTHCGSPRSASTTSAAAVTTTTPTPTPSPTPIPTSTPAPTSRPTPRPTSVSSSAQCNNVNTGDIFGVTPLDVCFQHRVTVDDTVYELATMYSCDSNGDAKVHYWRGTDCGASVGTPFFESNVTAVSTTCDAGACDASKYVHFRKFSSDCSASPVYSLFDGFVVLIDECIYNQDTGVSYLYQCTANSVRVSSYSGSVCTSASFSEVIEIHDDECVYWHFNVTHCGASAVTTTTPTTTAVPTTTTSTSTSTPTPTTTTTIQCNYFVDSLYFSGVPLHTCLPLISGGFEASSKLQCEEVAVNDEIGYQLSRDVYIGDGCGDSFFWKSVGAEVDPTLVALDVQCAAEFQVGDDDSQACHSVYDVLELRLYSVESSDCAVTDDTDYLDFEVILDTCIPVNATLSTYAFCDGVRNTYGFRYYSNGACTGSPDYLELVQDGRCTVVSAASSIVASVISCPNDGGTTTSTGMPTTTTPRPTTAAPTTAAPTPTPTVAELQPDCNYYTIYYGAFGGAVPLYSCFGFAFATDAEYGSMVACNDDGELRQRYYDDLECTGDMLFDSNVSAAYAAHECESENACIDEHRVLNFELLHTTPSTDCGQAIDNSFSEYQFILDVCVPMVIGYNDDDDALVAYSYVRCDIDSASFAFDFYVDEECARVPLLSREYAHNQCLNHSVVRLVSCSTEGDDDYDVDDDESDDGGTANKKGKNGGGLRESADVDTTTIIIIVVVVAGVVIVLAITIAIYVLYSRKYKTYQNPGETVAETDPDGAGPGGAAGGRVDVDVEKQQQAQDNRVSDTAQTQNISTGHNIIHGNNAVYYNTVNTNDVELMNTNQFVQRNIAAEPDNDEDDAVYDQRRNHNPAAKPIVLYAQPPTQQQLQQTHY